MAVTKTKNSYLAAQYQRLRGRRGPAKAVTAVGHSILTAAWHMLQTRLSGSSWKFGDDPHGLMVTR
ncbi:MAG: hypothetical protein ACR2OB_00445 [Solirubrobacteraceae bacterium]